MECVFRVVECTTAVSYEYVFLLTLSAENTNILCESMKIYEGREVSSKCDSSPRRIPGCRQLFLVCDTASATSHNTGKVQVINGVSTHSPADTDYGSIDRPL